MKPIQWLLVGGPAHGRAVWIKAGSSVEWGTEDGKVYRYEGRDFVYGAMYRLGVCTSCGEIDMTQVPRLIAETGLHPNWHRLSQQ